MHSDKKKLIIILIIIIMILLIGIMYIYMLEPEQPNPTGEEKQITESISVNQKYVTTSDTNKMNTSGFKIFRTNDSGDIDMKKV